MFDGAVDFGEGAEDSDVVADAVEIAIVAKKDVDKATLATAVQN
jgi:hypothetical protein